MLVFTTKVFVVYVYFFVCGPNCYYHFLFQSVFQSQENALLKYEIMFLTVSDDVNRNGQNNQNASPWRFGIHNCRSVKKVCYLFHFYKCFISRYFAYSDVRNTPCTHGQHRATPADRSRQIVAPHVRIIADI